MNSAIEAQSVAKAFRDGSRTLQILVDVNLTVQSGETVAILGRSGSGKSTLLHVLGGLLGLDRGSVRIAGECMSDASQGTRARIRNRSMGFVYQFHHLLPEFTAEENIAMPLWLRGGEMAKTAKQRATELLKCMDMADRARYFPHKLSGGEKQRVAVARALISEPAVVLGDELTGNLDDDNAAGVLELIHTMRDTSNTAFVLVTHDKSVAQSMDRTLTLKSGRLSNVET